MWYDRKTSDRISDTFQELITLDKEEKSQVKIFVYIFMKNMVRVCM